jgi:hypothetical protein
MNLKMTYEPRNGANALPASVRKCIEDKRNVWHGNKSDEGKSLIVPIASQEMMAGEILPTGCQISGETWTRGRFADGREEGRRGWESFLDGGMFMR